MCVDKLMGLKYVKYVRILCLTSAKKVCVNYKDNVWICVH